MSAGEIEDVSAAAAKAAANPHGRRSRGGGEIYLSYLFYLFYLFYLIYLIYLSYLPYLSILSILSISVTN